MMRRIIRWLLRLVGVAGVLAAIALGLYAFYLPREIERRIVAALSDMGLSDSGITVRSVTADAAHFGDIAVGDDGRFTIGSIDVTYDADALAEGRVHDVRVTGAQWRIAVTKQGVEIGRMAHLKLRESEKPGGLPFDRLELHASSIVLDYGGQSYRLPVEGAIVSGGEDTLKVNLRLDVAGIAVDVTGTISSVSATPTIQLTAKAFDSIASISGFVNNATGEANIHVAPHDRSHAASLDFERSDKSGQMLSTLAVMLNESNVGATTVGREALNRLGVRGIGTVAAMGRAVITFGGPSPWRIDPVSLVVNVEPGDVQLPETTLIAFTGKAKLGGVVTPEARRVTLSVEAAGGLTGKLAGTDTAAQRFDLKIDGESIDTNRLTMVGTLAVKSATLHDAQRGMDAAVDSFDLKIEGEMIDTNRLAMVGTLAMKSVTLRDARRDVDAAVDSFDLKVDGETMDMNRLAMVGTLAMKRATLRDAQRGVDATVDFIGLEFDGETMDTNRPTMVGMLEVKSATLHDANRGMDVADVTATMPLSIGLTDARPPGALTIGKLTVSDHVFDNLTGTLAFVDDRVRFTAVVPVLETASLDLNGHVTVGSGGVEGEVVGRVNRFAVTDAELLGRRLPALAAWRITGDFEADAYIAFAGSTLQPRVTLTMHNAMIGDSQNDIVADGVNGSVTVDSFAPLTTPPHQTLTIANAHVGKLDLLDGQIDFHLEGPDALFVERSRWQVESEGRVTIHAFRYLFGSEQIDVELYFEGVNLRDWLVVLTGGKVEGEGRLYGRVPLAIRPGKSDQLFRVGQGFFFADPIGGTVRVKDSQTLGDMLDKTNPQFAVDAQMKVVKQRIIEGLADYEYRVLTFRFVPDDDDVTLSIHTAGRGRTGAKQEFGGLTINLHKFNSILTRELIRELGALPSVSDELMRFFE